MVGRKETVNTVPNNMKDETIINKRVSICNRESALFGIKGTVKKFDGEYFYVTICGLSDMTIPFVRDDFRVCREETSE